MPLSCDSPSLPCTLVYTTTLLLNALRKIFCNIHATPYFLKFILRGARATKHEKKRASCFFQCLSLYSSFFTPDLEWVSLCLTPHQLLDGLLRGCTPDLENKTLFQSFLSTLRVTYFLSLWSHYLVKPLMTFNEDIALWSQI